MQLPPPAVFHDKYQWEIWKNTAGKSARGDNAKLCTSNYPILFPRCNFTMMMTRALSLHCLVEIHPFLTRCQLHLNSMQNSPYFSGKVKVSINTFVNRVITYPKTLQSPEKGQYKKFQLMLKWRIKNAAASWLWVCGKCQRPSQRVNYLNMRHNIFHLWEFSKWFEHHQRQNGPQEQFNSIVIHRSRCQLSPYL